MATGEISCKLSSSNASYNIPRLTDPLLLVVGLEKFANSERISSGFNKMHDAGTNECKLIIPSSHPWQPLRQRGSIFRSRKEL